MGGQRLAGLGKRVPGLPVDAELDGRRIVAGQGEFFGEVGTGDQAGVWEDVPRLRPEFRAETRRQIIKLQKRRKAEEMI